MASIDAIEFINGVESGRLSIYQSLQEQASSLVQSKRLKLKSILKTIIFTPCACARGKAISCVVVSTKIAISGDVGIQGTCKHSQSIEFGEKLAPVCVKSRDTVHNRQK